MNNVAILGAGEIGMATYKLLRERTSPKAKAPITLADTFSNSSYISKNIFTECTVILLDKNAGDFIHQVIDFDITSVNDIADTFKSNKITHIINALPFFLNEKVASAAVLANCHYIDFTEDDLVATSVQRLFANSNLTCAVKCGLAPGFINYVGHDLAKKIHTPHKLMITTGALPKSVSYTINDPGSNYNLSWSIDGLVNEYIKPCHTRINGKESHITACTGVETVIVDGVQYEAAFTSGGIGSLIGELPKIPNIYYKTLRYPGHYKYVNEVINRNGRNFNSIKKEFLDKFPYNKNDIIIVYAECIGKMDDSRLVRETFTALFQGTGEFSAIQSTTAGGALCVLELILKGQLTGIINHKDVPMGLFTNTEIYKSTYFRNYLKG